MSAHVTASESHPRTSTAIGNTAAKDRSRLPDDTSRQQQCAPCGTSFLSWSRVEPLLKLMVSSFGIAATARFRRYSWLSMRTTRSAPRAKQHCAARMPTGPAPLPVVQHCTQPSADAVPLELLFYALPALQLLPWYKVSLTLGSFPDDTAAAASRNSPDGDDIAVLHLAELRRVPCRGQHILRRQAIIGTSLCMRIRESVVQ